MLTFPTRAANFSGCSSRSDPNGRPHHRHQPDQFRYARLGDCRGVPAVLGRHRLFRQAIRRQHDELRHRRALGRHLAWHRHAYRHRDGPHHGDVQRAEGIHLRLRGVSHRGHRRVGGAARRPDRLHRRATARPQGSDDPGVLRKTIRSPHTHPRRRHAGVRRAAEHGAVPQGRRDVHRRHHRHGSGRRRAQVRDGGVAGAGAGLHGYRRDDIGGDHRLHPVCCPVDRHPRHRLAGDR